MKAAEARFLEFIRKAHQFKVPIYQRKCSWTQKDIRKLWDDSINGVDFS